MRNALERGRPSKFSGYGLAAWYRIDRGVTIATGISQLDDLSGNGRNLTQGTGSAQPARVLAAYNGKPCARFVAASSQFLSRAATNLFGSTTYSLVLCIKWDAASANQVALGCESLNAGCSIFLDGNARSALHAGAAAHDDGVRGTTIPEVVITNRAAGAIPAMFVNGLNVAVGSSNVNMVDPGAGAALALGASFNTGAAAGFVDADVLEAIAFTGEIPQSVISRISHYAGAYAGIAA